MKYSWFQTDDEKASLVAVATLMIPGAMDDSFDVPIDRYVSIDAKGDRHYPERTVFWSMNADGFNEKGGFGFNGSIDLDELQTSDETLVLHINFFWTSPAQIHGSIDETVKVKVREETTIPLKRGGQVKVTWRKGSKFELTEENAVKRLMGTKHVAELNKGVPGRKLACHVRNASPTAIDLSLSEDRDTHTTQIGSFRVNEYGEVFANGLEDEGGESWWKID